MKTMDIESILKKINQTYRFSKLRRRQLEKNPLPQFNKWFFEAVRQKVRAPHVMALAVTDKKGSPSVRMVLLKNADKRGFGFFTNYQSPKAKALSVNPKAEILFFWPEVERQVRIKGRVFCIPRKESEQYFKTRPRDSQLASWASNQSIPIASRRKLEEKIEELKKIYAGKPIPCPPFWGGFRLVPETFEFWQGRENRLNDRFRYLKKKSSWKIERLQP